MPTLLERNTGILARCTDLAPLREIIAARLKEGNREAIMGGLTPLGSPVAPLKQSTLKHRDGTGPARAPHGEASRVIAGFTVSVTVGAGTLVLTGSWPSFVRYLNDGTRRMAARPTIGFRPVDLDWARDRMRIFVMGGTL